MEKTGIGSAVQGGGSLCPLHEGRSREEVPLKMVSKCRYTKGAN